MQPKFFKQVLAILIITTIMYPPSLFGSGIIVDPRSGTVTLDRAQNGVQVINISAPNSRGLSHNRFVEFNVTRDGVILNNSGQNAVSVLGGALYTNPNMAGRSEATLILSEVTGVNRSNINGFTEVHGKRADYVLANPNGITCNGCGFINVNRATLTTGRPEIENGFLKNLNVQGGDVTIGSEGVNTENLSYFEIIARTAKIQGQINANDLSVVTGRNDYDYQTKQVTAKADDGSTKPELSIDATSLGSIYAGRIKMISTEAGVGVNVPNSMYADAGNIVIDSKGNLTYKNLTSSEGISLRADGKVTGMGKAQTNSNIDIKASQIELASGAETLSYGATNLEADQISNAGVVTSAGTLSMIGLSLLNSGELLGASDLSLNFGSLINPGKMLSNNNIFIITTNLDNSGELSANNDVQLNFVQFDNSGSVLGGNSLLAEGQTLNNLLGGELLSYKLLALNLDSITNAGDITAVETLNIDADTLNNSGEITSYMDANIDADQLINTANISTGESLNVSSTNVNNSGNLVSEQDIHIVSGALLNSGQISSNNMFDLDSTSFTNPGSVLSANVNINSSINNSSTIEGDNIWLNGSILNTGKINGWTLLDITTSNLNNTNGQLLAGVINKVNGKYELPESIGDLNLNYTGALTLYGKYFATGDLNISATGNIDNRTKLMGLRTVKISTPGVLYNQSGSMMAGVQSHPEFNFNSYGTLDIDSYGVLNSNVLYATGLVDIDALSWINNSYVILSKDDMDLYAGSWILNNNDSYIYSDWDMRLSSGSYIDNNLGIIKTEYGNMNITTGNLYNRSTLAGKRHPNPLVYWFLPDDMTFDYLTYTQYNGDRLLPSEEMTGDINFRILSQGDYGDWDYRDEDGDLIETAEVIEIRDSWRELGRRTVRSNLTTSDYSTIRSGGNITMNLGNLYNSSSDIIAAGNITINASGTIDNSREGSWVRDIPIIYLRLQPGADVDGLVKLFYVQKEFDSLLNGELSNHTIWFENASSCSWSGCVHVDSYSYLLGNILDYSIQTYDERIVSDRASNIIAGGNIYLNKAMLGQDGKREHTGASNLFYTDISGTTNQSYAVNTQAAQLNASLASMAAQRGIGIDVDGVFFRYASGASYLIETNPLFTDLNGLMSSNYFIERAGYNMDSFSRLFMGDAYWEKEYIAKQIEQEFNRKFIVDEVDSDAMQREVLLTNAFDIAGDLNLKLGVGLTEDQRKSLKKPIVWYVEQEQLVNGKKVTALVPKVYSPITSDFAVQLTGGVLSGKNIVINTDTDVQVGGIMFADGTTSVTARDFNLTTAQLRTNKLNVKLNRDMNVLSSKVTVLDSAVIDAGGSINIEGMQTYDRKLTKLEDGSSLLTKNTNYIGSKLDIGKDLLVRTGGNFGLMGSDINVGGSAGFDIGGDMLLASAQESTASERAKYEIGFWSSTSTKENHYTTTQKASNLNVGSDLSINAGRSLTLIASNISADNAFIEAKGDVNLISNLNETNDSLSIVKSGMLSKKIDETTDYKGVNVGSVINAKNTNYIKADGNINLVASELASENGAVALEATDVNLLSANDVTGHSEYHKTISYFSIGSILGSLGSFITGGDLEFGSFKEDTVVTSEEIAKGSSIRGPTVFVKTSNDFNLVGSNVSGQDVTFNVGRDLNLLSAEQQADYFSESKEGKLFLNWDMAGLSGVSIKGGVKYTEQKESTKTVTNVGSNIQAGNLNISTGRDMVLMGSNVVAVNQDISVGRDLNLLDVSDTVEHSMESTDVRMGVELRLTSNPLSLVDGIAGMGKTLVTGQMFQGINGAFGSFNDTLTNFGKINKGYDTGDNGHMNLLDGSGSLNYFVDISKHTENTNSTKSIGSNLVADNSLKLNTGNDLLIYGSNISAGTADINVGNNLDIRSSFDTSKNDSSDINVGGTVALIGGDVGNPSIHGSGTFTSGDSKWVNNLAGIQTANGLNINVKGNTNLEGGLINDANSKLTLNTGSLTFKDLEGEENSHTYGVGRSVDLDLGNESTNIKYAMVDKDQIARATIGGGTINVGGQEVPLITGLNRDLTKALEVTKDDSIDVDVDLDDRLFSENGRKEIGETFKEGATKLGSMADSVAKAVSDSGDGINGFSDAVDYSEIKINVTKTAKQMAESSDEYQKAVAMLNDPSSYSEEELQNAQSFVDQHYEEQNALDTLSNPSAHSAEELQNATQYVVQKVASQYGYSDDKLDKLKVIVYNDNSDQAAGFREKSEEAVDGDIGVNASKTGTGTSGYYTVLGHEIGHFQQAKNVEDKTAEVRDEENSEAYSNTVGDSFLGSFNDGLYIAGRDDVNTRFWSTGLEDSGEYLFAYNNNGRAASITYRENSPDTIIDIVSLGIGINSIRNWNSETSLLQKTLDVGGVTLDTIALATPFLTFGASAGVKFLTNTSKVSDTVNLGKKTAELADDASHIKFNSKANRYIDKNTGQFVSRKAAKNVKTSYPPNRGFAGVPEKTTLKKGDVIDRYGSDNGTFASPEGTSFGARSLPETSRSKPLKKYEVVKDLEVDSGKAAPWYGQKGKGTQYELPKAIRELIDKGYLVEK